MFLITLLIMIYTIHSTIEFAEQRVAIDYLRKMDIYYSGNSIEMEIA